MLCSWLIRAQNTARQPLACLWWERPLSWGSITVIIILHQILKAKLETLFHPSRITEPPARVRLTKTGRLNNTFITFWEAGGQVHVKSITREVSSDQLISPHARHTLLEIYAEDVLILLVLPFSQSVQTGPPYRRRRCKTSPRASSLPHKTQ